MKTVLQQAIETIQVFRNKASFEYKAATTNEDKEEWLSSISAIDSCLTVLKDSLPTEKEQIEQAYYDGGDNMCSNGELGYKQAETYYQETYKS